MPGGELEPLGYGPNLGRVSEEMGEIFARVGAPAAPARPSRPSAVSALRPERRGGGLKTLMVGAAAGLAGLGAGVFMIHAPPEPATPARAAAPVPAAPLKAPKAVMPAVVAQASLPPVATAPLQEPLAARPAPSSRAADRPAPAKPAPERSGPIRPAQVKAARREPLPVAQPASCEKNTSAPGCRRAVIQADRHLRNVYETAIRRGVPRAVLIDYRDRWADLRERDTDDPVRLIQSYGALAYDLGREAKDDGEGSNRRRDPSGLKALANALLPWW